MNILKQVLLYLTIPIVCILMSLYIDARYGWGHPEIIWFLPAGYIVVGLWLLLTKRQRTGKILLISGGVVISLQIVAFIIFVSGFNNC